MESTFFLKGLIIGVVIAAPLGPIGILCTRRILMHGRRVGFLSGMGAAAADAIYGFIAAFGLTFVSEFLIGQQFWLRLVGGAVLCTLGVRLLFARTDEVRDQPKTKGRYAGIFTSTFVLTLTNPMTIFSFAAVFAGFGLAGTRGSILSAGVLTGGVLLGSLFWWLFLVAIFSVYRRRLRTHEELWWVNRIAGVIIAGSGILALLSLRW
jgi:threonine/homoserine/homoserine lactone efflux protein